MKTFIHLLSNLDVVVKPDVTGGFFAVVPGLPGCGSQGESVEETLVNLNDAIMMVLDVLREDEPERLQQLLGASTHSGTVTDKLDSDSTASLSRIVCDNDGALAA